MDRLISSSLPSFVNGISQQPFTLRLNSQGEHQENGISTISQGLRKRPPTKHLAKVQSAPLSDVFIHTDNRDVGERYIFMVTNGDLKIYDIAGNQKTVNFGAGTAAYLTTAQPAVSSFAAVTVADYTWLVNKTITVAASSTLTPASPNPYEALINVKSGNYGKTYSITVNGTSVASFTTPNGATAADAPNIDTTYIANQLSIQLTANSITHLQTANSIYIYSSTAFDLTCADGFGNNAMVAILGKTQKFTDLPPVCPQPNVIVQVIGDVTNSFANYFVKFDTSGGSVGVWRECAAPSINNGLDASTMPFTIVRNSDGTFTMAKADWSLRKVGDLTSSTDPSFVGRTLNDIFYYQNRLGVLSDENVIMTESGKYFNFYRATVTALLDSDVIDVTASHTKVSILNHAIPYNKALLLFSDQTQFIIPSDAVLTPTAISLKVSTEYPCDTGVKPLAVGKNCYFPTTKGNWASVREYYTNINIGSGTDDATEITAHIPKYLPAGTFKLAGCPNEDTIALLTKGDQSSIYMYKYFFTSSNEKAQSSWSRWIFGANDSILNVDFIQSTMYLVISRPDGVYFESMDCSLGYIGTNEPYTVMLDRKITVTPTTYASGYTTIATSSLPYPVTDGTYYMVAQATGISSSLKAGEYAIGIIDGSNIKFAGDYRSSAMTFGRKYTFSYGISTITYKLPNSTGGGQRADTEGRLQVRKIAFNYADTGYLRVEITPTGRDTGIYTFSGQIIGNSSSTLGKFAISGGRISCPVVTQNTQAVINVINDSPLPSSLLSADWEGMYVKRSTPV